jgi:DNA-binding transcriptional regulator YhcF (GntR family)
MNFVFDNNAPIYIQLVEQLRIHIISGRLSAGERLPSVRDLALQIKVNPNTLQKALSELEDAGLIFTERTNGKFVTEDLSLIEKERLEYANELSQKFILNMENIGFTKQEAIKYLEGR